LPDAACRFAPKTSSEEVHAQSIGVRQVTFNRIDASFGANETALPASASGLYRSGYTGTEVRLREDAYCAFTSEEP